MKAQCRMANDPERQEASNDAKREDRATCGYIAALAWPGGRCNRPLGPGKHEQTYDGN